MSSRWYYAVLVLSLAVNAGALGFYGIRKYRDWRHFQSFQAKWFRPGTSRRQLDRLLSDLEKGRAPWFDSVRTATRELGLLAEEGKPDSGLVAAALDKIARGEREKSRLLRVNMREMHRLYRPEQLEFWRKLMQAEHDSLLRADSVAALGGS